MSSPLSKPVQLLAATLAILFFLVGVDWSLRSNPMTPFSGVTPAFVSEWSNNHGVIRNIPAYFILACLGFIAGRNWRQRMVIGIALAAFGGAVEIIQIWLPSRDASVLDALCSWLGIALAWAVCRLGRRALWRWREQKERFRPSKVVTANFETKRSG